VPNADERGVRRLGEGARREIASTDLEARERREPDRQERLRLREQRFERE
jgi:hypothetical protein